MTNKNYTKIVLNSLPEREMEIVGQIAAERMSELRGKALQKVKEGAEIDGFRKGNAPDSLVAQKVGEMRLLEEAAEIALSEEYPNILEEHNIDAIGRPEISITKIGVGSPLEFKIKTALMPDVKLADYKKIAESEKILKDKASATTVPEVSEKEVDDVVLTVRRNMAHQLAHAATGLGEHEHNHAEIKDEDLPPLDENFLKMLGDFKDVDDFKNKIRQNIAAEKLLKEKDKRRAEILEKIIKDSKIEMPKIIVEGEMEKMLAQFKDDLAQNGVGYDDYLKHIKKTEDDLKKEWQPIAEKRGKSQIILNTIAKEQNIAAGEDEVKKEMENILSHHKEADRFRVRMFVETFLTNELVFQFLEK
jgi:trigger factor